MNIFISPEAAQKKKPILTLKNTKTYKKILNFNNYHLKELLNKTRNREEKIESLPQSQSLCQSQFTKAQNLQIRRIVLCL